MKTSITAKYIIIFLAFLVPTLTGCISEDDETITPKPRSYYRLSFPERGYKSFNNSCPFTFEIPNYSSITKQKDRCWVNLNFPSFNGTLHLSYKPVNGDLEGLLKDSYTLASKHQIKASGMTEQLIAKEASKVYGLVYEIEGNAASAIQFHLTDSTNHFLRGALYFNQKPNIDSIAPVISFLKEDINHIFETFEWKGESL